jgi:hypothetical protein
MLFTILSTSKYFPEPLSLLSWGGLSHLHCLCCNKLTSLKGNLEPDSRPLTASVCLSQADTETPREWPHCPGVKSPKISIPGISFWGAGRCGPHVFRELLLTGKQWSRSLRARKLPSTTVTAIAGLLSITGMSGLCIGEPCRLAATSDPLTACLPDPVAPPSPAFPSIQRDRCGRDLRCNEVPR